MNVRAAELASSYWINDLQDSLVSLWLSAQDEQLNQELRESLLRYIGKRSDVETAKKLFKFMKRSKPQETLSKAVRLFIINRCSFSGTTESGGFSADCSFKRFNVSAVGRIQKLQKYLEGTKITCLDYEHLLDLQKHDLIYLDPPYGSTSGLYGVNGDCHAFDYGKLSALLQDVRGRFMLTLDDSIEMRKLFSWANLLPWTLQYSMNNCGKQTKKDRKGSELLITNYDITG